MNTAMRVGAVVAVVSGRRVLVEAHLHEAVARLGA